MSNRKVRMGIDVGGTHTKAVAIDNATHQIIGKSSVKTSHDDKAGVAAGVVQAFQNCLKENQIDPKDVIFVAHSTTQATNALIEGDVAHVGVVERGRRMACKSTDKYERHQSRVRKIYPSAQSLHL
jgi:N-methylhydantoinase A